MSSIRIAVGTICYNDKIGLERLVKSIRGKVDNHFIIDGKYPNFPGSDQYSNDGTFQMLDKVAFRHENNKVQLYLLAEEESKKRQKYLDLCMANDIDALLILDADEYVDRENTNWRAFRKEVEQCIVQQWDCPCKQNVYAVDGWWGCLQECPRLWIHPEQMEYVNHSHKTFKNKFHDFYLSRHGSMFAIPRRQRKFSFRFIQDSSFRTKERVDQSKKYYEWLNSFERY